MGSPRVTASPRAPRPAGPGPKLTPPPLGKLLLPRDLPLRCVTGCASVSVSDPMPSSLPCLLFAVSLSLALCLPLSLAPCVCVCVCVCTHAHASVCLSICFSLSQSWSLSLNFHLFLPLSLLTPGGPSVPLAPASHRCYGSG